MIDSLEEKNAAIYLAQLDSLREHSGWKLLWGRFLEETRRAEILVQTTPICGVPVDEVALQTAYRRGFLEGTQSIQRLVQDLEMVLRDGKTPWLHRLLEG